ncbi:hypothetical protein [Iningainema tapete]|uniref:Novel STAND NTPase 1 domain-containing protein n=1 Tax=Iningainema tapete BLCC-T55 TaxID=2748662 RepID=A0A8J7CDN3_9CYAN|nr:hypothetical protein [Iningainema tapete]MBD2772965.1 hypothetical protein [Iningainema tapete BLCC-T55]
MNQALQPQDTTAFNENSLQELSWAIESSNGEFSLILAHCNSASLQRRLMQRLLESVRVEIRSLLLDKSVKTLYTTIQAELGDEHPQALVVSGLESVKTIDSLLKGANQVREEFRKNFPFPVVLWVTDEVLQKLIRLAQDLQSWTTTVKFAIPTDDLIQYIQQTADEVFAKVLAVGAGRFLDNTVLNLGIGSPRRTELELARVELQNRGVVLHPEIEASLEFVLGRDAHSSMEQSRQHYERSLALLPTSHSPLPKFLEQRACLLYCMGLWWRTYAVLHHTESDRAREEAKDYFQECITVFEQAGREDLVANFINGLGAVLQRLQHWDELEAVAKRAITLHHTYPHQFRLARAYGFLAEVEIAKSAWIEAQNAAQQALLVLDNAASAAENSVSSETIADLEWEQASHRGWYLFALARTQLALGENKEAIACLETAKAQTKQQYDPELYIWILQELRNSYFEQGEYLKAFNLKLEQRASEQKYGFRAFIGAGRLQPKQQVKNPALALVEQEETVAQEIAATGREQDVKRLVERMGCADRKLTIIYGQSGVGKSSILQAGLIPALQHKAIGTRDVVPVLQQVYPDWIRELGDRLSEAIAPWQNSILEGVGSGTSAILNQLRTNADNELLTVLIFDQFEEFFFVYKDPKQRLTFYNFLRECLDVAHVRVILSLREDYLYYLLECNERLTNLEVINNNILDKDILYYLGNFSRSDTKALIQSFTQTTRLFLEPSLIDQLVEDLAGDFGEIRPIELQVVGTQLQTEKITKLEKYREKGPKEKLVERFLEEVVKDCGGENAQIANLVLYLLTDENNTRPLKTRADLELELEVKPDKLDLVLLILVKSGLVFKVPAIPTDRYQLVHDYLVPFVRQQQSEKLIAELEKEREQRKLTEAKLLKVTQRQLRDARRATLTLVSLLLLISGVATIATLIGINTYISNLTYASKSKTQLDQLVSALQAGKLLKQYSLGAVTDTQLLTVSQLNNAVNELKERNRLEGHSSSITFVTFSSDGKMIATASEDKTAKIWSINGKEIKTLKHTDSVTSVTFSSDDKWIATASKDKTAKIWSNNGKEIREITSLRHKDTVTSVAFNPDSKMLATGSKDKTVKLWSLNGREIKSLPHSARIISVSFSPDGKIIAAAGKDDKVKLWSSDGKEIGTINNYGTLSMSFKSDGKTLMFANKDGTVKYYSFDGKLIKTFRDKNYNTYNFAWMSISSDGKQVAGITTKIVPPTLSIVKTTSDGRQRFDIDQPGHRDDITYLSLSSDGKLLASASKDNTVKLWSIEREDFSDIGSRTEFSPDHQTIAASVGNNKVKLWRRDGTLFQTFPGDGSLLSFSPDSKSLITGSANDLVNIWDFESRKIKTLPGFSNRITSLGISPNGKIIAAASLDNTVHLWKSDGTPIKTFSGHNDTITSISFSPNNEIIATVGNDNVVKLWQSDGTPLKTLLGHTNQINEVIFSPDSEMIATIGDDNLVKLWKSDGTLIKTLFGHPDAITSVKFSPNSQIIASISQGDNGKNSEIRLWQSNGNSIGQPIYNYGIESITFSHDSNIVASINSDNTVKLWKLDGQLRATLRGHQDKINELSFSPDGKTIATASDDNTVKLWDLTGKEIITFGEHSDKVKSFSFSPDGKKIVSASNDKTVKIWNSSNGKEIKTFPPLQVERGQVLSVKFSTDGKIIASVGPADKQSSRYNYIVKLWSSNGKQEIQTLQGHSNGVNNFSFSDNGRTVAFVRKEDALKLWSINGNLLATLKGHSDWINSVSFSPDGKMIASASDDTTVKLWSSDGKEIKTLRDHSEKVNSVSFSPDGDTIASASADKTVKLWNHEGIFIKDIVGSDSITSITFSQDGHKIATLSSDSKIKLLRSWNGQELKTLEGYPSGYNSLSFSPDGNMLAFPSYDKRVTTYLLNPIWFKESADFISSYPLSNVNFSSDSKAIAVAGNNKVLIWDFLNLDNLLVQGCNQARDYLKNNPKVKDSDRTLCDDISTQSVK